MDGVLWYVLASSRGGPSRVRIVRAIDERPRNANQLAEALDLDYTTVRHHLDVLMENNVVRRSGDEYGAVYLFTDRVRAHWDTVEEILDAVDGGATDGSGQPSGGDAQGGESGGAHESESETGGDAGGRSADGSAEEGPR